MSIVRDIFTGLIGLALVAASCYLAYYHPEFWPQIIGLLWLAGKIYQNNPTATGIGRALK